MRLRDLFKRPRFPEIERRRGDRRYGTAMRSEMELAREREEQAEIDRRVDRVLRELSVLRRES